MLQSLHVKNLALIEEAEVAIVVMNRLRKLVGE